MSTKPQDIKGPPTSLDLNPDICAISSSSGVNNIAASSYTLQACSNLSVNLKKKPEEITFPSLPHCSSINQAPYLSSVSEKEMSPTWPKILRVHGANFRLWCYYRVVINCATLETHWGFRRAADQFFLICWMNAVTTWTSFKGSESCKTQGELLLAKRQCKKKLRMFNPYETLSMVLGSGDDQRLLRLHEMTRIMVFA